MCRINISKQSTESKQLSVALRAFFILESVTLVTMAYPLLPPFPLPTDGVRGHRPLPPKNKRSPMSKVGQSAAAADKYVWFPSPRRRQSGLPFHSTAVSAHGGQVTAPCQTEVTVVMDNKKYSPCPISVHG